MQSDGDTGGGEAREGGERTEIAHDAEGEHRADQEAHDEAAQKQKLPAAAQIVNVTEGPAAPDFGQTPNDAESEENRKSAGHNGAQRILGFAGDGIAPVEKIGAALIEHKHFLAERYDHVR